MSPEAAPEVAWVFGTPERPGRKAGPLHAEHQHGQAWCGVKMQFRHWRRRASATSPVDCPRCVAAINARQPRAWKS